MCRLELLKGADKHFFSALLSGVPFFIELRLDVYLNPSRFVQTPTRYESVGCDN